MRKIQIFNIFLKSITLNSDLTTIIYLTNFSNENNVINSDKYVHNYIYLCRPAYHFFLHNVDSYRLLYLHNLFLNNIISAEYRGNCSNRLDQFFIEYFDYDKHFLLDEK